MYYGVLLTRGEQVAKVVSEGLVQALKAARKGSVDELAEAELAEVELVQVVLAEDVLAKVELVEVEGIEYSVEKIEA